MSEEFRIVLTACLTAFGTVVSGAVIFVFGQLVGKFFIEPIHEQSKLIGEIANSLIIYADLYANPGTGRPEAMDEAATVFRQQASQLRVTSRSIPWYGLWVFLRFVPKRVNIIEASRNLIGLSNSIHQAPSITAQC